MRGLGFRLEGSELRVEGLGFEKLGLPAQAVDTHKLVPSCVATGLSKKNSFFSADLIQSSLALSDTKAYAT